MLCGIVRVYLISLVFVMAHGYSCTVGTESKGSLTRVDEPARLHSTRQGCPHPTDILLFAFTFGVTMHYVYRMYNRQNKLIYVGCTTDLKRRIRQHKRESLWIRKAHRYTFEEYSSKEEGRAAEARIIMDERPWYNTQWKQEVKNIKSVTNRRTSGDWCGGEYYPSSR